MPYYDPTDWDTQIDPYPIYARLREEAPVYHNEKLGFYALSRFEDVWDAHLDHQTFSSTMGPSLEGGIKSVPMMIIMDPPEHTRVRQLVSKVFTPRRVAELEPTVRQITRDRLSGLEPGDQIDLFERLGSSMPMDVISTLLGVPAQDRDRIRHLTNTAMHREGGLEIPASAKEAHAQVFAYFVDFIKERQKQPGDDLLSDLIAAEIQREDGSLTKLSFEELLGFCILLGNAGHETTARLICNSAVTLARHPDQRRQLIGAPLKLMENAVEEMLRFDPPSQVQGRWTLRPWTRHGVTIPANVRAAAHRRGAPRRAAVPGSRPLRHPPQDRPHGALRSGPPPVPREVAGAAGVPGGLRGDPLPLPGLRGGRGQSRVGAQQQRARILEGADAALTVGRRRARAVRLSATRRSAS
jgi:cytochrome P450